MTPARSAVVSSFRCSRSSRSFSAFSPRSTTAAIGRSARNRVATIQPNSGPRAAIFLPAMNLDRREGMLTGHDTRSYRSVTGKSLSGRYPMRKALGALGVLVMLAACQAESPSAEPERKTARRPPPPACDQARATLERRQREGAFLFEDSGEAMTDRQSWMRLDETSRELIIGTLAVLA